MEKKRFQILFTSVGRRVELVQQFHEAARRLEISLCVWGADITPTAPAMCFCDEKAIVPRIKDKAYIPTLLELCRENKIDALIPTIDTDLLLLAENRERFDAIGTTVWVGSPEKVHLCRDKRLTAEYFHSIGLQSPSPVDDVKVYNGGFPAFIKPKDGSSSINAYRVDNEEDLIARAAQIEGYIIQPFISGREYTVDIFCDDRGNPVYITPRLRTAVRSGEVLKTQIAQDTQIIQEMKKLVQDFCPRGALTVQLIRDERTGNDQYIEINPRFGGGAPLSMKAGADSAMALLQILCGKTVNYQENAARNNAVYSRFDQSVCIRERTDWKIGQSGFSAVIFDLDDTLYSEKAYIRSGFRAIARVLPFVEKVEERLWSYFEAGLPAIDALLHDLHIEDTATRSECLKAYRTHQPQIQLYPEVPKLLRQLHEKQIQIGILTDGRPDGQRAKLQALDLLSLVDTVIITDELGGPQFRKPNDIPFRIMQGRMQVPYEQMIYVGDNLQKDFIAPETLGMSCVYFRNSDGLYSKKKQSRYIEFERFQDLFQLFSLEDGVAVPERLVP